MLIKKSISILFVLILTLSLAGCNRYVRKEHKYEKVPALVTLAKNMQEIDPEFEIDPIVTEYPIYTGMNFRIKTENKDDAYKIMEHCIFYVTSNDAIDEIEGKTKAAAGDLSISFSLIKLNRSVGFSYGNLYDNRSLEEKANSRYIKNVYLDLFKRDYSIDSLNYESINSYKVELNDETQSVDYIEEYNYERQGAVDWDEILFA